MTAVRCAAIAFAFGLGLTTLGLGQQGPSPAPQPPGKGGFWWSIGAGYTALGAGCQTCGAPSYKSGLAVYARAGGTLHPGIGLGVQVASLTRGTDTTSVRMVVTTLLAQWHPWSTTGFYVAMGYGLSAGRQDYHFAGISTRTSHAGIGLNFEVGWDIRVGRLNITPNVSAISGALGDLEVKAQNGSPFLLQDAIVTGYQFGIAIGMP